MALYEEWNVDFEHADERGTLTQLVRKGFCQINVLESKKGITRGGHYHKVSKEAFYVVSGSVEVTFRQGEKKEVKVFERGASFLITPYVIHSMTFPEECIMVVMYDVPVEQENGEKDIYAGEL